jgi:alpha-D-ribose 1-methylphosphonate 5-triphosphate synthase subunit PhnH
MRRKRSVRVVAFSVPVWIADGYDARRSVFADGVARILAACAHRSIANAHFGAS